MANFSRHYFGYFNLSVFGYFCLTLTPAPFSCLPARMGSGKARYRVKGRVPCRFLGCKVPVAPVLQRSKRSVDQSPKPSESLPVSISAIFKVHLSLFFRLVFFINHLTLPNFLLLCLIADLVILQNSIICFHDILLASTMMKYIIYQVTIDFVSHYSSSVISQCPLKPRPT